MTDHLLDSISASMHAIDCVKRVLLIKKYNLWLKRKIQPEVEATSAKPQAASDTTCGCVDNFKKDLTAGVG